VYAPTNDGSMDYVGEHGSRLGESAVAGTITGKELIGAATSAALAGLVPREWLDRGGAKTASGRHSVGLARRFAGSLAGDGVEGDAVFQALQAGAASASQWLVNCLSCKDRQAPRVEVAFRPKRDGRIVWAHDGEQAEAYRQGRRAA